MASSSSARSSTLRAIGPCTPRLRSIVAAGVCATRPMLGRMPTTPQKLAGLRSEPPMSEPCASQAMPVASATAAPPEEPAAERDSVPGIARRAEHLVEGVGAGAEFRRVRFGVDHPAIVFEMLDQKIGARGDVVLVDRRALRGQHALDIGEVLDRHRHAREQAALAGRLLHQLLGMGAGAIEAQRRQRVDLAVDLGDPLLQHVEQIERRDVARVEFVDDGARRRPHQSLIRCHLRLSRSFRFFGSGLSSRCKTFSGKVETRQCRDRRFEHDDAVRRA